jgi:Actinobacteria/chloroflexi VLRF1 release factor
MRYVGRGNVRKMLEPLEGQPGRTVYADGAVQLVSETSEGLRDLFARPSFGLAHTGTYDHVHVRPLLDEIARDHVVSVLLVRLGGYAVGVFEGEELVASKVGSRFVKGRHKKGGSSANRFRRRREEQARALIEEAASVAARVLAQPTEFAALGGDRRAVAATLEECPQLAWLKERAIPHFLAVPEPRERTLRELPYVLYSVEVRNDDEPG